MRDTYSDDFESVATDGDGRLIPEGMRRIAGAAVFLGLVAMMALWAWRLGTRDASEVPIIRAMEGPSRLQPEDPGGLQAAHQGLEVNAVLGGAPEQAKAAVVPPARPPAPALAAEDAPQGELVAAAPQAIAEQVLGKVAAELPMPDDGLDGAANAAATLQPILPADATDDAALGEDAAPAGPAGDVRPRNRPAGLAVAHARPAAEAASAAVKPAAPAKLAPVVASPAAPGEVKGVKPGARLVQLGAYDSEEITRKAWSQLVARNPDLLASKSLYVERTTANARVFYRLRVAGFQSADDTRAMCEALRARNIACIPVTLQ